MWKRQALNEKGRDPGSYLPLIPWVKFGLFPLLSGPQFPWQHGGGYCYLFRLTQRNLVRRQIRSEITDRKDVNSQSWAEPLQPLTSLTPCLWPLHDVTGPSDGNAVGEGCGSGGLS